MTRAFAVVSPKGEIDLKTVYDSERGAKVNWLCVRTRVMPMNTWSDETISEKFRILAEDMGYVVKPISLEVLP